MQWVPDVRRTARETARVLRYGLTTANQHCDVRHQPSPEYENTVISNQPRRNPRQQTDRWRNNPACACSKDITAAREHFLTSIIANDVFCLRWRRRTPKFALASPLWKQTRSN